MEILDFGGHNLFSSLSNLVSLHSCVFKALGLGPLYSGYDSSPLGLTFDKIYMAQFFSMAILAQWFSYSMSRVSILGFQVFTGEVALFRGGPRVS